MARSAAAIISCALLAFGAALAAGCANNGEHDEDATPATPAPATEPADAHAPPPIRIHAGETEHELHPWSYCWIDRCVDGTEPEDPIAVGNPDSVRVEFPHPVNEFVASFREADAGECGRTYEAELTHNEDGTFTLQPMGAAGSYDVLLIARATEGDAAVMFQWETPTDGPVPAPQAALAIASDYVPLSQTAPDLTITDLRTDPERASVSVTITPEGGEAQTLESAVTPAGCPAGSLRFFTDHDQDLQDAPPPYRYDVVLQLDDETYEASAVWPGDQLGEGQPYVRLEFTPPLPALR